MIRIAMRSVLAVLAGYVVFGLGAVVLFGISGQDPKLKPSMTFAAVSTICGIGFALLGGFVAAWIGRRRPVFHGAWVGGIIAAIALISMVTQPASASKWSELTVLIFMAPAALVGGALRGRQKP